MPSPTAAISSVATAGDPSCDHARLEVGNSALTQNQACCDWRVARHVLESQHEQVLRHPDVGQDTPCLNPWGRVLGRAVSVLRHNRLSQRGCRNGRFPLLNRQCGASVVGYVTYRIYHTYMTGGFGACARYNVHRRRLHNTKCSVTHGLVACGAASVRRSERAAAHALLCCRACCARRA